MRANSRTIAKRAKELLKDKQPLIVVGKYAQEERLNQFKSQLLADSRIQSVSETRGYGSYISNYHGIRVTPKASTDHYSLSHSLIFTDKNELRISCLSYYGDMPCDSLDTFFQFIDLVIAVSKEGYLQAQKQEKINDLKRQGIEAKVAEIAREDKFEYACYETKTRVELMVKLNNRDALQINIPFRKFVEVMSQVRPILKTIREVMTMGVDLNVKRFGYVSWENEEK